MRRAYDADVDGDGIDNALDNCPTAANPSQMDTDGDGQGNTCDPDDDNDGVADAVDNCPLTANQTQTDTDGDGQGNVCDSDDDNDGVADTVDNCPLTANSDQANYDGDAMGDVCDPDDDNDGVADAVDAYPRGNLAATVIIGSCNSGVPNHVFPNGASFSDLISSCGPNSAPNHGQFVSCVSLLTNDWKKQGLISGAQKGSIQSCTN